MTGVTGTAFGEFEGTPCLKVFVEGPDERLKKLIPPVFRGYKVIIEAESNR